MRSAVRVCVVTSSRIDPRKPRALGFVQALVRAGHHVEVVAVSDLSLSGRSPLPGRNGGLDDLGVGTREVAFDPRRSALVGAAVATAVGRATSDVALYADATLRDDVRRAVDACRPDVVHVDRSRVLSLVAGIGAPIVVDLTDPRSVFFRQYLDAVRHQPGALAMAEVARAGLDLRAARREERELPASHLVLVASEAGRDLMVAGGAPAERVVVVPNPVAATDRADPGPLRRSGGTPPVVALTGNLAYPPNVLAALELVGSMWPSIAAASPGATLELVGAHPHPALERVAGRPDVVVRRDVADMADALRGVDVAVAPHRVCGGFPNRVIDALWRAGRPIVVSEVIARMAPAGIGERLAVARSTQDWVDQVLRSAAGGPEVAAEVRDLQDRIEEQCGIDVVGRLLSELYSRAGATSG